MSRRFPRLTWLDEFALALVIALLILLGTAEPDRDPEAAQVTAEIDADLVAESAQLQADMKFAEVGHE